MDVVAAKAPLRGSLEWAQSTNCDSETSGPGVTGDR